MNKQKVPEIKDSAKRLVQALEAQVKNLGEMTDQLQGKPEGDGVEKDFVLVVGLPGAGKSTVARAIKEESQAAILDMDEIKRRVVPKKVAQECVKEGRPFPLKYRRKMFDSAIRQIPHKFNESPTVTVIADETFHIRDLRNMMRDAGSKQGARVHTVEVVCSDEQLLKERLVAGKDRKSHLLAMTDSHKSYVESKIEGGEGGYVAAGIMRENHPAVRMYEAFKIAQDPLRGPHDVIDTAVDIKPQVKDFVKKRLSLPNNLRV